MTREPDVLVYIPIEGKFIIGFYRYDLDALEKRGDSLPPGEFKVMAWIVENGKPVFLGCGHGGSKRDALLSVLPMILYPADCWEIEVVSAIVPFEQGDEY